MPPLNLVGLPWPLSRVIALTLANPACTPDHALVMADALDEYAHELSESAPYHPHVLRVATELRTRAAHVARARRQLPDAPPDAAPPGQDSLPLNLPPAGVIVSMNAFARSVSKV